MKTLEDCVGAALAVLTPEVRVGFAADPITSNEAMAGSATASPSSRTG
jgi:hypothetical protein